MGFFFDTLFATFGKERPRPSRPSQLLSNVGGVVVAHRNVSKSSSFEVGLYCEGDNGRRHHFGRREKPMIRHAGPPDCDGQAGGP